MTMDTSLFTESHFLARRGNSLNIVASILFYIFLVISVVITFQHMLQLHIRKLIDWLI